MKEEVVEVIEYMEEFSQDDAIPKSVKAKVQQIIADLKSASDDELSLRINKLLSVLDEMSSDTNLDQFTRQQIWSISSMMESIN